MSKWLAVVLICGLVVVLIGAVRYLSRPSHLKRGNASGAGEPFGPQDPGG
jgi:hypothetical protein